MIVIYHANCIDGFTAAWVAWTKLSQMHGDNPPDGITLRYHAATYGEPLPPIGGGETVYVLDFSYPRAVLDELAARADLHVLDHHKTAEEDLRGAPYATFDMERSGAGITWDVLQRGPRPKLVDYVEDRDLWRFKLTNSEAVNAYVRSFDVGDFAVWSALARDVEYNMDIVVISGNAILRGVDKYVAAMRKEARWMLFAGYVVPVVNAPYLNTSELVGSLAEEMRPIAIGLQGASVQPMFAVGWYQDGTGVYRYSLRTRYKDFDVSEVARRFGGGGHKQAAGFSSAKSVHRPWNPPIRTR